MSYKRCFTALLNYTRNFETVRIILEATVNSLNPYKSYFIYFIVSII